MTENNDVEKYQAAVKELGAINRLLDRICRIRETNHIMSVIVDELMRSTDSDQGVINLVSPVSEHSFVTVARDHNTGEDEIDFKVGNLISGWVLKNRTMLTVDDLDDDERFRGLSSEGGKFKSILCCPMVVRGEIIGLTTLVRGKEKGPFSEDQARMVGVVASQSAHILSNALLLEELARKNELLEYSQQKLHDENIRLRSEIGDSFAFENIVGRSAAMRDVLTLASKYSANESPVLIKGPTGTGKELIARAVHYASSRKGKPFVIKNCGVKTESLLESELFGHMKGSFTGADRTKPGLFKEADGGTIFLDEVGDAPLSTQVAILRVLETGEIRPIGATKTETVDVRVISATNKDLEKSIESGEFRQDLFYRLNMLTIDMPPLSHRTEDIPHLVHHFLKKLRVKLGNDALSISPAALDKLSRYSWPGNVRQLEHEIERAAVVSDAEGQIDVKDLSPEVRGTAAHDPNLRSYRGKLRDMVEKIETDVIRATLEENDGNIMRTSQILGLTRKGLKDKMARYGIQGGRD